MRRRSWVAVACAAALSLVAPLAVARHVDVDDPRDTRGRLDIRRVDTWGKHTTPRFAIKTFARWTKPAIWDRGQFVVHVDAFGSPRFDYYVLVRAVGNRLRADLFRDRRYKRDFPMRRVRAWRPNARSVTIVFPLWAVRFPESRRAYRWAVRSLYTAERCRRVCIDRVPDKGGLRVVVRQPEPEPEPSPDD